jgi:hypothetical protein
LIGFIEADIQAYGGGRPLILVSALAPQLALLVVQEQLPPVELVERLVSGPKVEAVLRFAQALEV